MCIRSFAITFTAALVASSAGAQCTSVVGTDLVAGFRVSRPFALGDVQSAGRSAWTYRLGDLGGSLLSPVEFGAGVFGWGTPAQAYSIPLAGPIYSTVPAENESQYHDRAISMPGILMHPGGDNSMDMVVVFSPQNPIVISALSVECEVLGDISEGVNLSSGAVLSGFHTAIVPQTTLSYSSTVAHSTFTAPGGVLPMSMQPGDILWIRTNLKTAPFEDWANANLHMAFSGGPVLIGSPHDTALCANKNLSLTTNVLGSGTLSYQWQVQEGNGSWTNFGNGDLVLPVAGLVATVTDAALTTVKLTVVGDPDLSDVRFRCVTSNACHSVTSGAAQIRACIADRNCDGSVDLDDFFAWFNCWDATSPCAEINDDDSIDLGDFFAFFSHFDLSC